MSIRSLRTPYGIAAEVDASSISPTRAMTQGCRAANEALPSSPPPMGREDELRRMAERCSLSKIPPWLRLVARRHEAGLRVAEPGRLVAEPVRDLHAS